MCVGGGGGGGHTLVVENQFRISSFPVILSHCANEVSLGN